MIIFHVNKIRLLVSLGNNQNLDSILESLQMAFALNSLFPEQV